MTISHAGRGNPIKLLDGVTGPTVSADFVFNRSFQSEFTVFIDLTSGTSFALEIRGRIADSSYVIIKTITQADIAGGVFTEAFLPSFPIMNANLTTLVAGSMEVWIFN